MRFRRSFLASVAALTFFSGLWGSQRVRIGPHFWPTPNSRYVETGEMDGVLQPTVSGRLSSALFGCVRNNGHRFHEGVDLCSIQRDGQNESTDPVYAFESGIVRYVNLDPSTSSYGRYIVVEHAQWAPGIVTLYAHLRSVPPTIVAGSYVDGGQQIAVMGRSAGGYTIPQSRAHLHFELGYWLGPDFQQWYDSQPFGDENRHGAYNGMNIIGIDTWELFGALRSGAARDAWQFLQHEQIALETYVEFSGTPEIVRINASLLDGVQLPERIAGWRVEFTWYGLPIRFTPIATGESPEEPWGSVVVFRPDLLDNKLCMDLVRTGSFGGAGTRLRNTLKRLFVK